MTGTPLTDIRNIGPAMAQALIGAGIPDAETLRDLGAHEAYRRLLQTGTRAHFIPYYVLHMGLQGRPWNDCHGAEKSDLRKQFDTLKSQTTRTDDTSSQLERTLNEIGVLPRKR